MRSPMHNTSILLPEPSPAATALFETELELQAEVMISAMPSIGQIKVFTENRISFLLLISSVLMLLTPEFFIRHPPRFETSRSHQTSVRHPGRVRRHNRRTFFPLILGAG